MSSPMKITADISRSKALHRAIAIGGTGGQGCSIERHDLGDNARNLQAGIQCGPRPNHTREEPAEGLHTVRPGRPQR